MIDHRGANILWLGFIIGGVFANMVANYKVVKARLLNLTYSGCFIIMFLKALVEVCGLIIIAAGFQG